LLRHDYASACGRSTPVEKLWLFDVDEETPDTRAFGAWLEQMGHLRATIPSRKGLHYIAHPFDWTKGPINASCTLHKDNPTNLLIPVGAK
jgi:hypothetical protein